MNTKRPSEKKDVPSRLPASTGPGAIALRSPNSTALLDARSILMITGFYSQFEHQVKGVGGAMLNAIAKLAEARDCPFIVVLSGINPAVYEAFGFRLADPHVLTWYASTAFMKTRTKAYATPTTGAEFV